MSKFPSADQAARVHQPNPADLAAPIARHVAEKGALPPGTPTYWQSRFTRAWGPIPKDILRAFGLGSSAIWADVGRAVDAKLNPPKLRREF